MDEENANKIINAEPAKPQEEPAPSAFEADQNKPSKGMIEEAARGLEWRRKYNRGGTEVGVARARDISNGKNLSDDTVKRMHSFFSRHEVDKKGQGFQPGEDGFPSAGRIAWALWGGDAGQTWAANKTSIMAAKEAASKQKGMKFSRDKHGRFSGVNLISELVMPTPSIGESKSDFVSRCMGDDVMISEYPETAQRAAVCQAQTK
jgi:hypothetical protein